MLRAGLLFGVGLGGCLLAGFAACSQASQETLHVQLWGLRDCRLLDGLAAWNPEIGEIPLEPGFSADVERYAARTTFSRLVLRATTALGSTVMTEVIAGDEGSADVAPLTVDGSSISIAAGAMSARVTSKFAFPPPVDGDDSYFYLGGLVRGDNAIEIAVHAEDDERRTYWVDIERSVTGVLGDLEVESVDGPVDIVPAFDPAVFQYSATLSGSAVGITTVTEAEVASLVAGHRSGERLLSREFTFTAVDCSRTRTTVGGLVPGDDNVVTVTVSPVGSQTTTVYTLHLLVEE